MMLISSLKNWFTTPIEDKNAPQVKFWFWLSLLITIYYGLLATFPSFTNHYIIQDDARQHVFWTWRFWDSALFSKDLIADYYQSNAPLGYGGLYKFFALIGINPNLVSQLLPFGLSLMMTAYGFAVTLEILPVPAAGFINTLFLNHTLWGNPIFLGGTPRAFTYPLFLMFLYYLLKRSTIWCLFVLLLQGLFNIPGIPTSAGILTLRLLQWKHGLPRFKLDRSHLFLSVAGLFIVFLMITPEILSSSEFGPIIPLEQARQMPEFQPGGRTEFFSNSFWEYWFNSHRSGIGTVQWNPPILYLAFLIPVVLKYPSRFPLVRHITPNIVIFAQAIITAITLFFLTHALLFKLYLPSRYASGILVSTRFLTGIVIIIILDKIFRICEQSSKIYLKNLSVFLISYVIIIFAYWSINFYPSDKKRLVAWLALGIGTLLISFCLNWVFHRRKESQKSTLGQQFLALASTVIIFGLLWSYPSWVKQFPKTDYWSGKVPKLYEFLVKQRKDSLIASLTLETDNLPAFAHRSVLVSREYALPYHVGYYNQIRQRTIDLINAQYSPNLKEVKTFIQKYGIDFWLVENDSFTVNYIIKPDSWANRLSSNWILQYEDTQKVVKQLKQGIVPALAKVVNECSLLKVEDLVLLSADCIIQSNPKE